MSPPLEGRTVVALEHAVAGPYASRQLADLGARVIKIERPDGGDFARHYDTAVRGMGSHFIWLNRGKQSLALDLKRPAARDALGRLLARADVFIQNLSPGASTRLGLGAAQLRERHPALVVCDITGYGTDGPYAAKRAYDLLIQAETAVVSVTGTPGHLAKAGIPVGDIAASNQAATAVLAALLGRERTGEGASIEVSLLDSLAEWMGYSTTFTRHTGVEHTPIGTSHPSISPYDAYPTADGPDVIIGVQNDREWQRLATDVLGRPELGTDPDFATNPARVRRRGEVDAIVAATTRTLTAEQVVAKLDAAGVASGKLNTVGELVEHPQLAARDRWHDVDTPVGPVPLLKPPAIVPGWESEPAPVPALGEHTDAVLRELGYTSEEIAALLSP